METEELKLQALEEAIKYPKYSDNLGQSPAEITESQFDLDNIITNLIQFDLQDKNLIQDILQILSDHQAKYRLTQIGSIKFAWKGLPILILKISPNFEKQNMMYIELNIFKTELAEKLNNKKIGRFTMYVLGSAVLLIGGLIIGLFYKSKK